MFSLFLSAGEAGVFFLRFSNFILKKRLLAEFLGNVSFVLYYFFLRKAEQFRAPPHFYRLPNSIIVGCSLLMYARNLLFYSVLSYKIGSISPLLIIAEFLIYPFRLSMNSLPLPCVVSIDVPLIVHVHFSRRKTAFVAGPSGLSFDTYPCRDEPLFTLVPGRRCVR